MGIAQPHDEEYCTECGHFVDSLNSATGWCNECTRINGYGHFITLLCPGCNRPTPFGKICSRCKYESWLQRNADAIELVMAMDGVSVRTAKEIVSVRNRPICQSCHQPIKGGQKGRHYFCTKNPECIKAHNVYEYNLRTKPQNEALQLAITASVIYKLTSSIYLKPC